MVPLASKRVLKKCGYKLVESFMMNNKLTGDKIRRVLQSAEFINEKFYKQVEEFFGEKFLRHQSDEVLKSIFEFRHGYQIPSDDNLMSETEKKNAFEVFKSVISCMSNLQTFIDHINFYKSNVANNVAINAQPSISFTIFNNPSLVREDDYDYDSARSARPSGLGKVPKESINPNVPPHLKDPIMKPSNGMMKTQSSEYGLDDEDFWKWVEEEESENKEQLD
jgi:hypothetical protein